MMKFVGELTAIENIAKQHELIRSTSLDAPSGLQEGDTQKNTISLHNLLPLKAIPTKDQVATISSLKRLVKTSSKPITRGAYKWDEKTKSETFVIVNAMNLVVMEAEEKLNIMRKLEVAMRPLHAENINILLASLAAHKKFTNDNPALVQIFLNDCVDELLGYSGFAVAEGLNLLKKTKSAWYPTLGEILETIQPLHDEIAKSLEAAEKSVTAGEFEKKQKEYTKSLKSGMIWYCSDEEYKEKGEFEIKYGAGRRG